MSSAEEKAQEAKNAEALTPVEQFVASGTRTNYELFTAALEGAKEMIVSCYERDSQGWIPAGEANWLMQQMDQARNFLALAETYFRALSTPLMQAASIHIQTMQHIEATAPRELSAVERQELNALTHKAVRMQDACPASGRLGFVIQYETENHIYEIMVEGDQEPSYHLRGCFELES